MLWATERGLDKAKDLDVVVTCVRMTYTKWVPYAIIRADADAIPTPLQSARSHPKLTTTYQPTEPLYFQHVFKQWTAKELFPRGVY